MLWVVVLIFGALITVGVWAIALVALCSRRDIDPHDKITWVVVLLVLNALGALIYFGLGPDHPATQMAPPGGEPAGTRVDFESE